MKRSINSLLGYIITGTDGEIGKVEEFYFDDRTSTIRYIIVKTGGWFSEKRVLISTEVFQKVEWESKTFSVNLTQEKIKNSPSIDTDKPVSQQQEESMRGYYTLPAYLGYGTSGYWGLGIWGYPAVGELTVQKGIQEVEPKEHESENSHLRSTHEVTGYRIHALDGDIGKVNDFVIDDITWKIQFLVVEAGNWLFGKKVLFSPDKIKEIDWKTGAVIIDTTIAQVKNNPAYNPELALTHPFET
jgi:sporulation protein YlmC with PRC-barrel domain